MKKYREHKAALQNAEEAKALLDESGADAELKELARTELEEAKENIERTRQELKVMLLPRDPNDDRNVIVEIRGGAGGEEAAPFCGRAVQNVLDVRRHKGLQNRSPQR